MILPVLDRSAVTSDKPSVLLTIPPIIAFAAPPIPSPPKILTTGGPQKSTFAQSGLMNGVPPEFEFKLLNTLSNEALMSNGFFAFPPVLIVFIFPTHLLLL